MKKTFAILLSLALVVTAFFALTMTSSAAAATAVEVTKADTSVVTLDATTKTTAGTTGTVTFDAATGTVTLDGVTGIKKIVSTTGAITVDVKGTNTFENAGADNCIYTDVNDGDITVKGTGTLNLTAKAYVLTAQKGNVTIDGSVKLNVISTDGAAVHTSASGLTGVITVKGDVVLTVNATNGPALYTAGKQVAVNILGNAKLDLTSNKDGISAYCETPSDAVTGAQTSAINIGEKADVKIDSGSCALRSANNKQTGANCSVVINGEAKVNVSAPGQTIYVAPYLADGVATFEVSGKANLTAKNTGTYSTLQLNTKGTQKITITTTGTVDLSGSVGGWSAGPVYMAGVKTDVLIKDATVKITNTVTSGQDIVNAFNMNATTGSTFTIGGKANVTCTATNNSEGKICRAHGIWVNPGTTFIIQDDAKVTSSGGGTAAKSFTGGGFQLRADMIIKDNAVVTGIAFGNGTAGFNLQGTKGQTDYCPTLTIEGNATVVATSEKGNGIASYDDDLLGCTLDIKGGNVTASSASATAIGSVFKTLQIKVADNLVVKAGENAAGAEKKDALNMLYEYINVALPGAPAPNPGTSDLAVALIASVSVLSVMAAAAVVLRKKIHG